MAEASRLDILVATSSALNSSNIRRYVVTQQSCTCISAGCPQLTRGVRLRSWLPDTQHDDIPESIAGFLRAFPGEIGAAVRVLATRHPVFDARDPADTVGRERQELRWRCIWHPTNRPTAFFARCV
jgi:hypothetical protein